jgi:hypothetical protein
MRVVRPVTLMLAVIFYSSNITSPSFAQPSATALLFTGGQDGTC